MAGKNCAPLLRIDLPDGSVRLWGGVGVLEVSETDPFDPGGEYNQLDPNGEWITSLPVMSQLVGGIAEALDFTFSGIPSILRSWVDSGAALGCRIYIAHIDLDSDLQQDGEVWVMWSGIIRQAAGDDDEASATITLTAETTCASRSRSGLQTWTNANFRQDHPTDGFCSLVGRNGFNVSVKWP